MKKAFTMIELVFVIVIVGIISVMIAPNFQGNNLRQAADQLVSHIRYTQHLAMMDNKFDINDDDWFQERWQIAFVTPADAFAEGWAYTIFGSTDHDANPDNGEVAVNPLNPSKLLTGGYTGFQTFDNPASTIEMNLGKTYGIENILFSNTCQFAGSQRISFDSIGRPLRGSPAGFGFSYQANRLIQDSCVITLCQTNPCDDNNVSVQIEPETGYTHIL